MNPTSPKGVKAWGEGPLRPKEIIQLPRHTRPDPRRCQRGQPKCDPTIGEAQCYYSCSGICCAPHLTGKYGTRPFLCWVRTQGRSPHAPGISKNAYGPIGIPLIKGRLRRRAMNPTSPKGVKAWGEGPLRPKEIIQLPRHTRPDPRRCQHGQPKCDPTIGEAQCYYSCSFLYQLCSWLIYPLGKSIILLIVSLFNGVSTFVYIYIAKTTDSRSTTY